MLNKIERPFRQVDSETNVTTWFCANSLAGYIQSTGNTKHPLTRKPLTEIELLRLERASGLNVRASLGGSSEERRTSEDTSLRDFLEADVFEVVADIVDEASDQSVESSTALLRCRLTHGARFDEAIANLREADADLARRAVSTAAERLQAARYVRHPVVQTWAASHIRGAYDRGAASHIRGAYGRSPIAGLRMVQFFQAGRRGRQNQLHHRLARALDLAGN
jgi:hypothetical protein